MTRIAESHCFHCNLRCGVSDVVLIYRGRDFFPFPNYLAKWRNPGEFSDPVKVALNAMHRLNRSIPFIRFSLLLLEPGELYLEDFSCVLLPSDVPEETLQSKKQVGRLKMCSKSIVFDPQEFSNPVLKIQFKDCTSIQCSKRIISDEEKDAIDVVCTTFAEMLQGNVIAPYNFIYKKTKFLFLLTYAKADNCLPQILQLYRASTLLPLEQNSMVCSDVSQSFSVFLKFFLILTNIM